MAHFSSGELTGKLRTTAACMYHALENQGNIMQKPVYCTLTIHMSFCALTGELFIIKVHFLTAFETRYLHQSALSIELRMGFNWCTSMRPKKNYKESDIWTFSTFSETSEAWLQ